MSVRLFNLRLRFWTWAHQCAEGFWHGIYYRHLRPLHIERERREQIRQMAEQIGKVYSPPRLLVDRKDPFDQLPQPASWRLPE